LHSQVLENSAPGQPSLPQLFQPSFHFSSLNYGYYCFISYSLLPFPSPAGSNSLCKITPELKPGLGVLANAGIENPPQRAKITRWGPRQTPDFLRPPRNAENQPCFPRTKECKGEYNQEEEQIGVSAGRQVVVQCGQRGFCFDQVFFASRKARVGSCRRWKQRSRSKP
jgi:hypothetical protein